jgi:hypothetical protein
MEYSEAIGGKTRSRRRSGQITLYCAYRTIYMLPPSLLVSL